MITKEAELRRREAERQAQSAELVQTAAEVMSFTIDALVVLVSSLACVLRKEAAKLLVDHLFPHGVTSTLCLSSARRRIAPTVC